MRAAMHFMRAVVFSAAAACQPIQIGSSGDPDSSANAANPDSGGGAHSDGGGPNGGTGGKRTVPIGGSAGSSAGSGGMSAFAGGGAGGAPSCSGDRLKVSGRVTTPTGAPLPGVTMTLVGDASAETTTDERGDYSIEGLCQGSYALVPSREGLLFCSERAIYADLAHDSVADFAGSSEGCDTSPLERRLMVLVYDPVVGWDGDTPRRLSVDRGWDDPVSTIASFVHALEAVSNGHVRYGITETAQIDTLPAKLADSEAVDYDSIIVEYGICDALERGAVDEIWLAGGPDVGFLPWQELAGSCRRAADLVGFDYSRGLTGMFAGFQARSEAALAFAFQFPPTSLFEDFRRLATDAEGGGVSGCGTASFAPNAVADHPFDNPEPLPSRCDAYFDFPSSSESEQPAELVGCAAWGCSELGYRQYWLRHLPKASGLTQGLLSDWWRYVLSRAERITRGESSCSSNYTDGWCWQVRDGQFGQCNTGEWATAALPRGWVEFHWPDARPVHSLRIHDRACMERVVRGHVEFSDGSEPIEFGPLDNDGLTPAILTFDEKLLSGLRVYIDESSGMNPGFGEIFIE